MPPRSFCSSRAPSLIGGSLWSQREGGGCRKERIPLNSGDPAKLPRMLVPLSLHSPCDEVLSGLSVLLRRLRGHSLFAKAVAVLTLPTRELVTCRGSSSRSTMTHFGVRTPPWWTGAPEWTPLRPVVCSYEFAPRRPAIEGLCHSWWRRVTFNAGLDLPLGALRRASNVSFLN